MRRKNLTNDGFTLLELLVAMTISLIVMGSITFTFSSQQNSYIVQQQVACMQQNLRGAMYILTRDVHMAGYYTNFVSDNLTMDWDDLDGDTETIRPLIYARDNMPAAVDNIKDGTDVIVLVEASNMGRQFTALESASGTSISASLRDVDNLVAGKCALLVKRDLTKAEFFQVEGSTGVMTLTPPAPALDESYSQGDWIFRADVVIYYVDDEDDPGDATDNDDPLHPKLRRKNIGNNEAGQIVADGIDNLQFRYLLENGTWTNDPAGNENNVRGVEISLLARTAQINKGYTDSNVYNIGNNPTPVPNDGYRRRVLTSIAKTRNIGL
jgi:type IV pilus assembly protein PilW